MSFTSLASSTVKRACSANHPFVMSQGPPIPPCYISYVNDNSQPEELEQCAALQMHGNTAVAHHAPANVSDTNLPSCTVRLWEFSRWVCKLQPLLAPRASVPPCVAGYCCVCQLARCTAVAARKWVTPASHISCTCSLPVSWGG